jgi:hypothetical protein
MTVDRQRHERKETMEKDLNKQIKVEAELSEEQLDQVGGGAGKDQWPDPPQAGGPASGPSIRM